MATTVLLETGEARKARGAFFTPPEICDFIASWAVRAKTDLVMEPSCGEAAILVSAARRLASLGSSEAVVGFELHDQSARVAESILRSRGYMADIRAGDFLVEPPQRRFAAVVGNPPYVRYQGFAGPARDAGIKAALAQGVRLTGLASSWAPFVIHASAFLAQGGRLALVLPAELLSSNYASAIRMFLLANYDDVRVVLFDHHVFSGVQMEALVLLADGRGGSTNQVHFGRVRDAVDLANLHFDSVLEVRDKSARWTTALVSTTAVQALEALASDRDFGPLDDWGRVNLGAVTGSNRFFGLTPTEAAEHGLATSDTVLVSPPGSGHLRSLALTRSMYAALGRAGSKTLLFCPEVPSPSALAYIKRGEDLGVQEAYKCRVREPWWRVPLLPPPDLFFTYMNAHTPQMAANPHALRHLNSVHGVYVAHEKRSLVREFALASLNSATALSAEVQGRSYGGGILKMEPREAAKLLVPSSTTIRVVLPALRTLLPWAARRLRSGGLADVMSAVDELLLVETLGINSADVAEIRRNRNHLANRRQTRARKP